MLPYTEVGEVGRERSGEGGQRQRGLEPCAPPSASPPPSALHPTVHVTAASTADQNELDSTTCILSAKRDGGTRHHPFLCAVGFINLGLASE